MMLDIEDFVDHLEGLFARRPQQKLYRYDVMSDTICFEPEYGASAILANCFARSRDKYLLFYTKSDNVDHLLDLPKSNSIFYCTLSTETVCRVIERDTPSLDRRILGLRRCSDAGYPIRLGFSPIIPVRNWREEATQALEKLFAAIDPQVVRLWVISLMKGREFERAIDVDLIDPIFVSAMRDSAPELDALVPHLRPFPRAARQEVYAHYIDEIRRLSPDTLVGLCSEDCALWDALADKLNMTPSSLFCCCGGSSPVPPK
jgi:DNA repair photolyase